MYQADTVAWANSFAYQGNDNWRLPSTNEVCYGPDPCTTSEMGYLYWTKGITASSPSPFFNVRPGAYWSETTFYGIPWYFPFSDGSQGIDSQNPRFYAWAVADGKVSPVPEPGTLLLMGFGIAGVVVLKRETMV